MANQVKKYDADVTWNVTAPVGGASAGMLYGWESTPICVLADDGTVAVQKCAGFAVADVTATDGANGRPVALSNRGIVEFSSGNIVGGAFTVGAVVYVGTAGKPTTTKPTTNTRLVQPIGYALSTTKACLAISQGFLLAQTAGNSNIGE